MWTTLTQYWWYPPASELMTAGVISAVGVAGVPIVNACAYVALAFAVYENALVVSADRTLSFFCAMALVTSQPAIVQAGDMQNDVLLAAIVSSLAFHRARANNYVVLVTLAVTKPVGCLYGVVIAMMEPGHRIVACCAVLGSIGIWWIHNAILAPGAYFPIPSGIGLRVVATSIAAHGLNGVATLVRSSAAAGASTATFVAFGVLSMFAPLPRPVRILSLFSIVIWFSSPFSFESGGIAQLEIGSSLRFGLPTMSLGAVSLAAVTAAASTARKPIGTVFIVALATMTLQNILGFDAIYANTILRDLLLVVVSLVWLFRSVFVKAPESLRAFVATSALFSILVLGFSQRSQVAPLRYYASALREGKSSFSLVDRILATRATTLVANGSLSGIIAVIRPDVRLANLPDSIAPCSFAQRVHGTILFVHGARARTDSYPGCSSFLTIDDDRVVLPTASGDDEKPLR